MKVRDWVLILLVIATVIFVKRAEAKDNIDITPEYLPGIEASFEVVHPLGHVNQFEIEVEKDLELEDWMSCSSTWKITR